MFDLLVKLGILALASTLSIEALSTPSAPKTSPTYASSKNSTLHCTKSRFINGSPTNVAINLNPFIQSPTVSSCVEPTDTHQVNLIDNIAEWVLEHGYPTLSFIPSNCDISCQTALNEQGRYMAEGAKTRLVSARAPSTASSTSTTSSVDSVSVFLSALEPTSTTSASRPVTTVVATIVTVTASTSKTSLQSTSTSTTQSTSDAVPQQSAPKSTDSSTDSTSSSASIAAPTITSSINPDITPSSDLAGISSSTSPAIFPTVGTSSTSAAPTQSSIPAPSTSTSTSTIGIGVGVGVALFLLLFLLALWLLLRCRRRNRSSSDDETRKSGTNMVMDSNPTRYQKPGIMAFQPSSASAQDAAELGTSGVYEMDTHTDAGAGDEAWPEQVHGRMSPRLYRPVREFGTEDERGRSFVG